MITHNKAAQLIEIKTANGLGSISIAVACENVYSVAIKDAVSGEVAEIRLDVRDFWKVNEAILLEQLSRINDDGF
jgi:hypothetical protein